MEDMVMEKPVTLEAALKELMSWKKRMQIFGRNWSITETEN